ncbi:MAG: hypothetical protein WBU92_07355, partial [Candidatus Dormiibacterota bacterium]
MKCSDVGLMALRLATGATLAAHGLPKLMGGEGRQAPAWLSRLLGPNYQAGWERSCPKAFSRALGAMGVPKPELAAQAS